MSINMILFFHFIGISIFSGFILLDRIVFRKFFENRQEESIQFYKQSYKALSFSVILITASGLAALYLNPALIGNDIFIFKLIMVFLLFFLFFGCPRFATILSKSARRAYRFLVFSLLIAIIATAVFIN